MAVSITCRGAPVADLIAEKLEQWRVRVHHHEVLPTVAIVVEHGDGATVAGVIEAGYPRHLDEVLATFVQEHVVALVPAEGGAADQPLDSAISHHPERRPTVALVLVAYDRTPEVRSYVYG